MTIQYPPHGERLTRGLLYRFVSNATAKWDADGRPTPTAFDPQTREGDKGISFFRQDLLDPDPDIAAQMVLEGLEGYGLVAIQVEQFFAACDDARTTHVEAQRVDGLQEVIIYYDPGGNRCPLAHYYMVEVTDTVELDPHIKDILCEVADVKVPAKRHNKGGRRATLPPVW